MKGRAGSSVESKTGSNSALTVGILSLLIAFFLLWVLATALGGRVGFNRLGFNIVIILISIIAFPTLIYKDWEYIKGMKGRAGSSVESKTDSDLPLTAGILSLIIAFFLWLLLVLDLIALGGRLDLDYVIILISIIAFPTLFIKSSRYMKNETTNKKGAIISLVLGIISLLLALSFISGSGGFNINILGIFLSLPLLVIGFLGIVGGISGLISSKK